MVLGIDEAGRGPVLGRRGGGKTKQISMKNIGVKVLITNYKNLKLLTRVGGGVIVSC